MFGADCCVCKQHNATLRVTSAVDKSYEKPFCFECWNKFDSKAIKEKQLKATVCMY